jgi:molecular chaperone GrpE
MPDRYDDDESGQATAEADVSADAASAAEADVSAVARSAEAELRREKDALQDRLLRTAAEFDNYRKRVERDRRDQADSAVADAIEDLLPIIDNLERALDAPAGPQSDGFRKGVELIHQQMLDLLKRRGVKPIVSVGADFDPRFHHAVAQDASADHREGEVMEEMRRGYMLGERVLRPAMVKVAKA